MDKPRLAPKLPSFFRASWEGPHGRFVANRQSNCGAATGYTDAAKSLLPSLFVR